MSISEMLNINMMGRAQRRRLVHSSPSIQSASRGYYLCRSRKRLTDDDRLASTVHTDVTCPICRAILETGK